MGTQSNTKIIEADGSVLVNMYRQMDGYPNGHGQELAEFLDGLKLCNGIPLYGGGGGRRLANGMDCLAAQMVAYFKDDVGRFYLVPAKDGGNDYTYEIHGDSALPDQPLRIIVKEWKNQKPSFDGNLEEFKAFCAKGD